MYILCMTNKYYVLISLLQIPRFILKHLHPIITKRQKLKDDKYGWGEQTLQWIFIVKVVIVNSSLTFV